MKGARLPPSKERVRVLERELSVANIELQTAAGLFKEAGMMDTAQVILTGVGHHEQVLHGQRSERPRPQLENLLRRLTIIADGFSGAASQATGPNAHLKQMAVDNCNTLLEAMTVLKWQG